MRIAMVMVFTLGLGYSAAAFASDEFVNAQDHATSADLYAQKAAEQSSLINQHERMMKDSDFMRKNPSATAQMEMAQHCGAIISAAKNLQNELKSAGDWHKKQ